MKNIDNKLRIDSMLYTYLYEKLNRSTFNFIFAKLRDKIGVPAFYKNIRNHLRMEIGEK